MASALQAAYEAKIRDGTIQADPAQAAALASLVRLEMEMCGEEPEGGILAMLRRRQAVRPRGVYLIGPVGRGKSMLMDLFYETVAIEKKRRTHFHVFMGEIHRLINGDARNPYCMVGITKALSSTAPSGQRAVMVLTLV